MSKSAMFYVLTLYTFIILFTKSTWCTSTVIIIHGTWAKNESWYQKEGSFFHEIEVANNYMQVVDEIVSFSWSGKLGYPEQLDAGKKLAEKILEYDFVILIGHSHGVTVGIISSMMLGEKNSNGDKNSKIKKTLSTENFEGKRQTIRVSA